MTNRAMEMLIVLVISIFTVACGGENKKGDAGASKDGGPAGDAVSGGADAGDAGDAAFPDSGKAHCGNGRLEKDLGEVCDDGNLNDNDGCTSLCEYSCINNDDCNQDLNDCNGTGTCNADHYCDFSPYLEAGTPCGNMKSCYSGFCMDDVCGDAKAQNEEECDDGNTVDNDGCTTKCKYSCTSNKDCEGGDTCAGTTKCDTAKTHTCTGTKAANETPCKIVGSGEDGWCQSGVCVPPNCGDKKRVDPEECDLGSKNGKSGNGDPGSGCSIDCKILVCGDSTIQGNEQCEDGDRDNLDTCDKDCRTELWYRFTRVNVLKEPAPEWCAPAIQGKNRFGEAFPGTKLIPGMGQTDVLSIINNMLNSVISDCTSNVLNRLADSSDPSFQTTDTNVSVYVYDGQLEVGETCSDPLTVDTKFGIKPSAEADPYVAKIPTAQRPGMIRSVKPADVTMVIPGIGTITLYDLEALLPVDMSVLSTPQSPPTWADSVKLPERLGFNDPNVTPYQPLGRFCAAVGQKSMSQQPVDSASPLIVCCKTAGGAYRECKEGDEMGKDCDTFLDVLKQGCIVCMSDVGSCPSSCATPLEVIRAVEPDIDTDGDGVNDAYSTVIGVEGVRVQLTGVKQQ